MYNKNPIAEAYLKMLAEATKVEAEDEDDTEVDETDDRERSEPKKPKKDPAAIKPKEDDAADEDKPMKESVDEAELEAIAMKLGVQVADVKKFLDTMQQHKALGESVEQLDEISKETKASYLKKANKDSYDMFTGKKPGSKEKMDKRRAGIQKVSKELEGQKKLADYDPKTKQYTREEVELDEATMADIKKEVQAKLDKMNDKELMDFEAKHKKATPIDFNRAMITTDVVNAELKKRKIRPMAKSIHEPGAMKHAGKFKRYTGKNAPKNGEKLDEGKGFEAQYKQGMKGTVKTKKFKDEAAFEKWLDKNEGNVEVMSFRDLDESVEVQESAIKGKHLRSLIDALKGK